MLDIPEGQKVLLYVGRLAKEKNLETLIEAAALLIKRDKSLRLMLVGDGPHRLECKTLVRKFGIGDQVRFAGFLMRPEVEKYYSAADLFVFPSMTETQGLVVLEAMSFGLPPIAVGGGGASEGMRDGVNGFVVSNEASGFALACRELLDNQERYEEVSRSALETAKGQSPEQAVQKVLSVYRNAIELHRSMLGRS